MTVEQIAKSDFVSIITLPCPDREINGVYIGDLLSWVMGRAEAGNVWITIMSNLNIVAVATLSDVSCILLSEGVKPDADALKLATERGINILTSECDSYECAVRLYELLK